MHPAMASQTRRRAFGRAPRAPGRASRAPSEMRPGRVLRVSRGRGARLAMLAMRGNQNSGAPRHRRDVVSVAASARCRGVFRPSTRRCRRDRAGSMAWRFTNVHAIILRISTQAALHRGGRTVHDLRHDEPRDEVPHRVRAVHRHAQAPAADGARGRGHRGHDARRRTFRCAAAGGPDPAAGTGLAGRATRAHLDSSSSRVC